MKIKQLQWKKTWGDDKKNFWYETTTKPPFEYCIDPDVFDGGWTLWLSDANTTDKKLGKYPTSQIAKLAAQRHFEKNIAKLYLVNE